MVVSICLVVVCLFLNDHLIVSDQLIERKLTVGSVIIIFFQGKLETLKLANREEKQMKEKKYAERLEQKFAEIEKETGKKRTGCS